MAYVHIFGWTLDLRAGTPFPADSQWWNRWSLAAALFYGSAVVSDVSPLSCSSYRLPFDVWHRNDLHICLSPCHRILMPHCLVGYADDGYLWRTWGLDKCGGVGDQCQPTSKTKNLAFVKGVIPKLLSTTKYLLSTRSICTITQILLLLQAKAFFYPFVTDNILIYGLYILTCLFKQCNHTCNPFNLKTAFYTRA